MSRPRLDGVALAPAVRQEAGPWPTLAAREAVSGLLRSWDDAQASRLFSPNVAMDAAFDERQQAIAAIRERIGDLRDDEAAGRVRHARPLPVVAGGRARHGPGPDPAQPGAPARVQSLTLAVPPAAGSPLADALAAVLAWLNGTDRDWPEGIPVAETTDTGLLARRLRMAAVWAGACQLGAYRPATVPPRSPSNWPASTPSSPWP